MCGLSRARGPDPLSQIFELMKANRIEDGWRVVDLERAKLGARRCRWPINCKMAIGKDGGDSGTGDVMVMVIEEEEDGGVRQMKMKMGGWMSRGW